MTARHLQRDPARLARISIAALALAASIAHAASTPRASEPAQAAPAFVVPADLAQLCVADTRPLRQALATQWTPAPAALEQWMRLARTLACDLSGARDLGWHRVPLRAYATALRFPFSWIEWQSGDHPARRHARVFQTRAQLPGRLEFNVSGTLGEIRYDARRKRLSARFLHHKTTALGLRPMPDAPPATSQCASTQLQFRRQHGVWLLSGVESMPGPPC